tara:strand:+ start:722 stop:1345 length:624 start_codon:yes stop_codon:yes gene_type:complete
MDWLDIIEKTKPKNDNKIVTKNKYIYKSNRSDHKFDYDKIINEKMDENSDIEILEKITIISKYIKIYIIDKDHKDIENYVKYINWIFNCIKILAIRNKQEIKTNVIENNTLTRNSYKFCDFNHKCKYAYSFKNKCYSQHFVYSLLYDDIYNLLNHIKNSKELDMKNIKTSINTITYVITHMNEEMLDLKLKSNSNYKYYLTRKININ